MQRDNATYQRGAAEYMAAMQNLYGGQRWDLAEPHAAYAWTQCRQDGYPCWEEVREQLKASWPCPVER